MGHLCNPKKISCILTLFFHFLGLFLAVSLNVPAVLPHNIVLASIVYRALTTRSILIGEKLKMMTAFELCRYGAVGMWVVGNVLMAMAMMHSFKEQTPRTFKVLFRLESICDQKLSIQRQPNIKEKWEIFSEKGNQTNRFVSFRYAFTDNHTIISFLSLLCRYPFLTGGVDEMDLRFLARIQR